jgi:hypothetical protein
MIYQAGTNTDTRAAHSSAHTGLKPAQVAIATVPALARGGLATVAMPVQPAMDSASEPALAGMDTIPEQSHSTARPWLFPLLLLLGLLKLGVVGFIFLNTHAANKHRWNERAVGYRYLAERLRAIYYLPQVGSFRPPAVSGAQQASRELHQSAMDWLFNSITRAVSPVQMATPYSFKRHDSEVQINVNAIVARPLPAIEAVRDDWVAGQVSYHQGVATSMAAMHRRLEKLGSYLSISVIVVVVIDILIIILSLLDRLPHIGSLDLHAIAPWLVFMAAVLPAAMAGLNGIRFQSECRRLADRSSFMRVVLGGPMDNQNSVQPAGGRGLACDTLSGRIRTFQDVAQTSSNSGSWSHDVLRLTEKITRDFTRETAEWTVLYSKELPET